MMRPESPLVPPRDEWFEENPLVPTVPCRCEPDDRCGRCED